MKTAKKIEVVQAAVVVDEVQTRQVYPQIPELFTDLKKVAKKYKKDPAKLDAFLVEAKNDIAKMLIAFTKQRKLVQELQRKTSSQTIFNSVIFNDGQSGEIWGEVNLAISSLLVQWENNFRNMVEKGKPLAHSSGKGEVRLEKINDLCGYFRNSLNNAFADLFIKHHAQKRSAPEVNFSSMQRDTDEDNERNFEDTLASSSSTEVAHREYKKDMINYLRHEDKKNGTKTAKLFVALMNPRYNGAVTVIQNRLKINNKTFNDNKALIEKTLREEFGDVAHDLIQGLDSRRGMFDDLAEGNKASRQYKNRKKQKQLDKKASRPCRMNVVYGCRPVYSKEVSENPTLRHITKAKKWVYYVSVVVDRSKTVKEIAYSPDNWETVFKKEESIEGKADQLDKMKEKLAKMIKKDLSEAQKIVGTSKPEDDMVDDMVA